MMTSERHHNHTVSVSSNKLSILNEDDREGDSTIMTTTTANNTLKEISSTSSPSNGNGMRRASSFDSYATLLETVTAKVRTTLRNRAKETKKITASAKAKKVEQRDQEEKPNALKGNVAPGVGRRAVRNYLDDSDDEDNEDDERDDDDEEDSQEEDDLEDDLGWEFSVSCTLSLSLFFLKSIA
jgi:hypothetical protein